MIKVKPIRIAKKTQDAISYLSSNKAILSKKDNIIFNVCHTIGDAFNPKNISNVISRPSEILVGHRGDGDSVADKSVFH